MKYFTAYLLLSSEAWTVAMCNDLAERQQARQTGNYFVTSNLVLTALSLLSTLVMQLVLWICFGSLMFVNLMLPAYLWSWQAVCFKSVKTYTTGLRTN